MKIPVPEFFKGLALTVGGTSLTVRELLTDGSLLLTCGGCALAMIGGYWAYRSKRTEHAIREVELEIKRAELEALEQRRGR